MKQPLTTQCLAVESSKQSEGRVFVVRRATLATVVAAASLSDACTTLLGSGCVLKRRADIAQSRPADIDQAFSVPDKHFACFLPAFFQNCGYCNFQNRLL